ncbi:MAG TPA: sigma-70 family RNA polymerase sigma factor [Tepidisphaeraceae bacterium]|nr:sigma-70 family RNA polymerase sigma factor [Tepidisphaeraceae bacterium]
MISSRSDSNQPDDLQLAASMAGGDTAALRIFYDRYASLVLALANRILFDRQEAEELLQDVFLEFWRRASAYDEQRGSPRTFLILLTRSRAIDRLRSRGGDSSARSIDTAAKVASPAQTPQAYVDGNEQASLIRQALGALSADQREALEAAFYDGLSHAQIAAKLNKPLGTVKTYIRQAIDRLRDSLSAVTDGVGR